MDESALAEFVDMVVDRPFLFSIRIRPAETPLFFGRVSDGDALWDESTTPTSRVVVSASTADESDRDRG